MLVVRVFVFFFLTTPVFAQTHLVVDHLPANSPASSQPRQFRAADSSVYFNATIDSKSGIYRYQSANEQIEPVIVSQGGLSDFSYSFPFVAWVDKLVFTTYVGGGTDLYLSDGILGSEKPLYAAAESDYGTVGYPQFVAGQLAFARDRKLMLSDGQANSAHYVDAVPWLGDSPFGVTASCVVYSGSGAEPWCYNVVDGSNKPLVDESTGTHFFTPSFLLSSQDKAYFWAKQSESVWGLHVTDGATVTPLLLNTDTLHPNSFSNVVAFNGGVFIFGDCGSDYCLWRSDGSRDGTVLLRKGSEYFSPHFPAQVFGSHVCYVFSVGDNALWCTDGVTGLSTKIDKTSIAELIAIDNGIVAAFYEQDRFHFYRIGSDYAPVFLAELNAYHFDLQAAVDNHVVMTVSTAEHGEELAVLNVEQSTLTIKDLETDVQGASSEPETLVQLPGRLLYFAGEMYRKQWWATSGDNETTELLTDEAIYNSSFRKPERRGNKVYAVLNDDTGLSLWETQGNKASTRRIASVSKEPIIGERFAFETFSSSDTPFSIRRIDLIDGNARSLEKLCPGQGGELFTELDDLYFICHGNGAPSTFHVLRTTGVVERFSIKDSDGAELTNLSLMARFKGKLYLSGRTNAYTNKEVYWLVSYNPENQQSEFILQKVKGVLSTGDRLLILQDNYNYTSYWGSDGSASSLQQLGTTNAVISPDYLFSADGYAYYFNRYGPEIWRSNALSAPERVVSWPHDPNGRNFRHFFIRNGEILSFALNESAFYRLYSVPVTGGQWGERDALVDNLNVETPLLVNQSFYYAAYYPRYGVELWRTTLENRAPTLTSDPVIALQQHHPVSIDLSIFVNDSDNDGLSFIAKQLPDDLYIDAKGFVKGQANVSGFFNEPLFISDATATIKAQLTINIQANIAPKIIRDFAAVELTVGDAYSLDLTGLCEDEDHDAVTWTVQHLPSGLIFVESKISGAVSVEQSVQTDLTCSDGHLAVSKNLAFVIKKKAETTTPTTSSRRSSGGSWNGIAIAMLILGLRWRTQRLQLKTS